MADEPKTYHQRILESLAKNAGAFASVLPLSSRRQVADLARQTRTSSDSEMGPYLETIIGAMSDTRCEGLCAF